MTGYRGIFGALCIFFILACGCTSLAVGDAAWKEGALSIHVSNNGDPVEAGIQVRVYQIDGLNQKELTNTGIPVTLARGDNTVNIPVSLEPGTYKLYVYVTINSERQTASIKDLVV